MIYGVKELFSSKQLATLYSVVQIGDATYRELMESERRMFRHPYLASERGRIRTKLVQMQCELESHEASFPFEFVQREFDYGHVIPELHTNGVIIHIARSLAPDKLPYESAHRLDLSYNNNPLQRQMVIDPMLEPPYSDVPFYGILVFGGQEETFSVIQFPEPGYTSIADTVVVSMEHQKPSIDSDKAFERKKAKLKKEFLDHGAEEEVS